MGKGGQKKKARRGAADDLSWVRGVLARGWEGSSAAIDAGFAHAGRVIAAATILTVAIAWIAGTGPLQKLVSGHRAEPIRVSFAIRGDTARALGEAVRIDLEQRVIGAVTSDPFDRASLDRAQKALAASGWFIGSPTVSRRPGGLVRVEGEWRTPAAVVVYGGVEYLVDQTGAPLCLPIGGKPGDRLYRIRNPWAGPPENSGAVAYGEPWTGGDVQMGIEVLRVLTKHPKLAAQVMGVDLSNCLRSGVNELRLTTQSGATLVWGAPPSAPAIGEVPTARKLQHLEFVLSGTVKLDRPGAPINLHMPVIEIDQAALASNQ